MDFPLLSQRWSVPEEIWDDVRKVLAFSTAETESPFSSSSSSTKQLSVRRNLLAWRSLWFAVSEKFKTGESEITVFEFVIAELPVVSSTLVRSATAANSVM